jgi:16S rRNA (uracil1498-N3)-methyltransferase
VTLVLIPPGSAAAGTSVLLDDDEQHHLKVRRLPAGSGVGFADGAGVRGTGHLVPEGRGFALAIASVEQAPAPVAIVLGVGAGDRDRFGWMVEKATELGVTEIVPLETERTRGVATGLKPGHLDKLRRRAREVLKQCGGAWVPLLRDPQPLAIFLERGDAGARWVLDAGGSAAPALDATTPASALVGPEGGLTDEERAASLSKGFVPVVAGPLTLRFETAAIAAAVLIQASRQR